MRGDEFGEGLCEADFVLEMGDRDAFLSLLPVGEENGEGVQVIAVDAGDVWIGDDDVGEIAQGLDAVGEADGEEGEGEVCGAEEGFLGEWRAAVSIIRVLAMVWKARERVGEGCT
jgi:hypothetical protein